MKGDCIMMTKTGGVRRALSGRVTAAAFLACALASTGSALGAPRPLNIMITGYWPPTNNMLRQWSTNPAQNPGAWTGGNWEGRGYQLYAYFPEFPGMSEPSYGKGTGDFEVDYQDTTSDFLRIVDQLKPVAIVSFSRAGTARGWEMEPAYQRFRVVSTETAPAGRTISLYSTDYLAPSRPTDSYIVADAVGTVYPATLPMQQVVDAVRAVFPSTQIDPFIAAYNPATPNSYDYSGSFLSGYMPYLAARYRAQHASPTDPLYCAMSGHIHVGGTGLYNQNAWCTQAAEITLREVIKALDQTLPVWLGKCSPADLACDTGEALISTNRGCTNNGINEGDYNAFFSAGGFFEQSSQGPAAVGAFCDVAYDNGEALPPFGPEQIGPSNSGVNEGDYNLFFNTFFLPCS
jgi:hypothetical protein